MTTDRHESSAARGLFQSGRHWLDTARVLGSDAAVAVGRFEPAGVSGYRAESGGPLRHTRVEAEADQLCYLDGRES